MIILFEIDDDRLAIEKDGVLRAVEIQRDWEAKGFGSTSFKHEAEMWLNGNWEPNEMEDRLYRRKSPVATWSPEDGLQLLRRQIEILPLAQTYMGINA